MRAVRLAGTFVAYEDIVEGTQEASDNHDLIRVLDLTGRTRPRVFEAGGYSQVIGDPPYEPPLPGTATDLLLTTSGTVAWISQNQMSPATTYSVSYATRGSSPKLVTQGTDVAPYSLAIARARLYWTQGDSARAADIG